MIRLFESIRESAGTVGREAKVLWLCVRHTDTPFVAKLLAGLVVAYALSPIDIIPDFIPVLGLLDDAIIIPIGILLVWRFIPPHVVGECRRQITSSAVHPPNWVGTTAVLATWVVIAALVLLLYCWGRDTSEIPTTSFM